MSKTIFLISFILIFTINLVSKPYKGAEFRTKQSFLYGKFEVRMKSAGVSGMLSSFFTYHDNDPDINHWNEIDIEIMGRYNNEVQFNVISPGQNNHVFRQKVNFDPSKSFHVYATEWTPNYISWSVDGFEVYRQVESHIPTISREQKLMMNIWQPTAVDWAGAFNPSDLPTYAFYDWVKYYSYTPGKNNNFTLEWFDDFNLWDQNRWGKATHTFDGNNVDFMQENVVFKDGYMILCLTNNNSLGYNGGQIIDKDIVPPYVIDARSFGNEILINFSEKISRSSSENIDNYAISGVVVKNAKLQSDSQSVKLLLENLNSSVTSMLVLNIEDRSIPINTLSYQRVNIKGGLTVPIAIDIGKSSTNDYLKDQIYSFDKEYGYEGGNVIQRTGLQIGRTNESEVYQTAVEGIDFYKIRVSNGTYSAIFMFAEIGNILPGMRVFDIYINGDLKAQDVDISYEVGINTAFNKTIENLVINNNLIDICFKSKIGKTILNGLKIIGNNSTGIKRDLNDIPKLDLNAFPNPFNSSISISYYIPETDLIKLKIFDLYGKDISTIENRILKNGVYTYQWNASNFATGIYFCVLISGKSTITKKIFLIK